MKEEWRPVREYGLNEKTGRAIFEASNTGLVRKAGYYDTYNIYHEPVILTPFVATHRDFYCIRLAFDSAVKLVPVHRIIAKTFIPQPVGTKYVKWRDGNKFNNSVDNLYWTDGIDNPGSKEARRVRVYTTSYEYLGEFPSLTNVAKIVVASSSQISRCCNRKIDSYLGLIWRFTDDDEFYNGIDSGCDLSRLIEECATTADGTPRCGVRQYSLEGKLLGTFKTVSDAIRANGSLKGVASCIGNISKCCTKMYSSAYGFVWRYTLFDELFRLSEKRRETEIKSWKYLSKTIRQYTFDGVLVREFSSLSEVAEVLNLTSTQQISSACHQTKIEGDSKTRSAYGFIWRYDGDDELFYNDIAERRVIIAGLCKSIRKLTNQYDKDGHFIACFKSCAAAAQAYNVSAQSLRDCCLRRNYVKSCVGYIWRYMEDDEFYFMSDEERKQAIQSLLVRGSKPSQVLRKGDDDMSRRTVHTSLQNKKEEKFLDKTRPVRKYSMTGVFLSEYASLYEISKRASENYNIKMIYKCCMRETTSSYNHIWRFADDDEFAKGQAPTQVQSDVPVEPSNPADEVNVVSNSKDTSVPIDVGLDVSEIDIRFNGSLRPSRTMKILDPNNGRYDVIDLDTQRMETLFIDELFWRKASGDRIEGCSFHTNGLMFELDGFAPYIVHLEVWRDFMVDDAHYLVSNLGRVGRSIDGEFPPQMVTPYENDGVHCRVDLYYGDNYFITYNLADLVARAFLINYDPDVTIEFLDRNFMNCAFGNLSCNADASSFGKVPVEPVDAHMYSTIGEYSLDGALRATYQSVSMAAALSGHSADAIKGSCEQKAFTCGSSVFAYSDNNAFAGMDEAKRADMFDSFVRQYNNKGELVGEYKSIQAVEEHTGYKAYVIDCACGQTKPKYGFVWRKAKDDEFFYLSVENRIAKLPFRAVRQYTKSGYLLGDFPSVQSAATELGLSADLIGSSAANPQKTPTAEGYAWRYVDSDELYEMPEYERMKAIGYMFIRQYSVDGIFLHEYESVDEAYYASNVTRQEIIDSCEKKNKIKKRDFVWRYSHNDELLTLSVSDRLLVMSRFFLSETSVKTTETAVEEYEKAPIVEDSMENWTAVSIYNVQYDNGLFKYEVSDKGRVRIRNREKATELHLLTQVAKQYGGHLTVTLIDKLKVSHTAPVDRLVALAFVPKPANCDKVWHKDGDIQNNDASNLIWIDKNA